jgi:hypothetical protein
MRPPHSQPAGLCSRAVLVCSLTGYITVRREMLARVDADLAGRVASSPLDQPGLGDATRRTGTPGAAGRAPLGSPPRPTDVWVQTVTADGSVTTPTSQTAVLPVTDQDTALAGQPPTAMPELRDVEVDGVHLRMITAPTGEGRPAC